MPEDNGMEKKLNPQIHEVEVGIRGLRKIQIYPLSLGDQFKISDVVKEVLTAFFNQVGDDPELSPEVASVFFDLFKTNFPLLIGLVAKDEDPKKLQEEITNEQFSEIVEIVWKDNFEGPAKKLKGLFGRGVGPKVDPSSLLERPSPASVDITDTPLPIATESITGKGA